MENFLKDYYSILNDVVLLLAAITTICVRKKFRLTNVNYFLWFLMYAFIVDLIGGYTVYVANYSFLSGVKELLEDTLIRKNYWCLMSFGQ